ncbi:MAG: TIGR01777 family oxidoreductase [Lysinibacillus sp.]
MKVVISGGTGFVGQELTKLLISEGHKVVILTRNESKYINDIQYVQWLKHGSQPENELHDVDAFVNLAGVSLNEGRWTKQQKKAIYTSRMDATLEIVRIMENLMPTPKVLVNASAVGIYPASTDTSYTENNSDFATDFLGQTVKDWERHALRAESLGVRVTLARLGVILGKNGGALPMMVLPYKFYVGGTVGSGKQWLSWVHVEDVARAFYFALLTEAIIGPFNVTAPDPQPMKTFGETIAAVLQRPHWMPVPKFAMQLALGEQSILVLEGQHVLPTVLESNQFIFKYPHLKNALENLL